MDYTKITTDNCGRVSRVGIIGASRGYGYTLLAQLTRVELLKLRLVCSRHPEECVSVLTELGYPVEKLLICDDSQAVKAAGEDCILVVHDYRLALESGIDSVVECTGNTAVSADIAERALKLGINVYMVSKETDSVCGPYLNDLAEKCGAVYALANGDQPRNLVDLYSWGKLLGLEIIVAGKSSEYDFVWDPETGDFECFGSEKRYIPELQSAWKFEGCRTLEAREALLKDYTGAITADLCEMNLVSNVTGLVPAHNKMHYPIAKVSELADIFIPVEDGGILTETGVVDVFFNLRRPDEASFAGGEFIIVKCENAAVWELLKGKGHIVSQNGKYACLYYPYHFMGVETPASIVLGDFMKIGTHPECRPISVMAGVANRELQKGSVLSVYGHHHEIDGLDPELIKRTADTDNIVPFYLLNNVMLHKDVKLGEYIMEDAVDMTNNYTYEIYKRGLKL